MEGWRDVESANVKTVFLIILTLFALFTHLLPNVFSSEHMICGDAIAMVTLGMCACTFLCLKNVNFNFYLSKH